MNSGNKATELHPLLRGFILQRSVGRMTKKPKPPNEKTDEGTERESRTMWREIALALLVLLHQFAVILTFLFLPALSGAQTLPTTPGWYEIPNTTLRGVCSTEPSIQGATGCNSVIAAWGSGVLDTTRNRLIMWGGGHNNYYGNELYALNLDTLTVTRITDPGLPAAPYSCTPGTQDCVSKSIPNMGCMESVTNFTQPNSRHPYDGIEYMPNADRMFVFSGALACGSGDFSLTTWTFHFASETWTRMNPLGPQPIGDAGMLTAYDPNTGLIFLHDRRNLFSYNFQANTYTKLEGVPPGGFFGYYGLTAAIDPKRKLFVIIGPDARDGLPHTYTIDISSGGTYAVVDRTTTGDTAITDTGYPGIDYDPVSDRMVAWNGGDTVYSLNLDTNQWSSVTYSGGQS